MNKEKKTCKDCGPVLYSARDVKQAKARAIVSYLLRHRPNPPLKLIRKDGLDWQPPIGVKLHAWKAS